MLTHSAFLKQIKPAIEEVRAISELREKTYRREYTDPMHSYSLMDNAFVPNGQYDVDVQSELRGILKYTPIKVTVSALAGAVRQIAVFHYADPSEKDWRFSDFIDDVSAAGDVGALVPIAKYWLCLSAYCCAVVYGSAGGVLPDLPLSPETERTPADERHPRICLTAIPGKRPWGPYGDDGKVVSGQPNSTHDPKVSGWRA